MVCVRKITGEPSERTSLDEKVLDSSKKLVGKNILDIYVLLFIIPQANYFFQ